MHPLTLKKYIRARDGYRCTECGLTAEEHEVKYRRQLHVHRTTPGSEYSLEPGVCVTICEGCHVRQPRLPNGMGKPRGYTRVELLLEPELSEALRIAAKEAGETMSGYAVHAACMELGIPYVKPKRGRKPGPVKGKVK